MKKKIKNVILSLLVAFALLLSGNFPLAFGVVNTLKNLTVAEYEPTDFVTPYEFSTDTGWSNKITNNEAVKKAFYTKVSENLSNLTTYKPSENYKGASTNVENGSASDFGAMVIRANPEKTENDKTIPASPVKIEVEKKDDDGNIVWQKDGDNFVFKKDGSLIRNV